MAAEIEEATGVSSKLVPGDGGVFDVFVDDELRFSKHDAGRYPASGEILALIRG